MEDYIDLEDIPDNVWLPYSRVVPYFDIYDNIHGGV